MKIVSPTGKQKILKPVRPNAGRETLYYRAMHRLLERMHNDVQKQLERVYKRAKPEIQPIAKDASPFMEIRLLIKKLTAKWTKAWSEESLDIVSRFCEGAEKDSTTAFKKTLKDVGFTVPFKPTRRVQQVMGLAVQQNVSLIKSIPAQYLKEVEGAVLRSAMAGRDLSSLTDELTKNYGIARRRAAFIARDQNNKMTAVVTRERRLELGITEAIWLHSHGGKKPRPSHEKAGREKLKFDVAKGAYIDGEYIQPGELPNCRCTSRPVIPGWK